MDIILGIDPGLNRTGWGIITRQGNALGFVAAGVITPPAKQCMSERLKQLHEGLRAVVEQYRPTHAAVEQVFVNTNPRTSLLLGQARGLALLAPAQSGIEVAEYTPSEIKKALVGAGRADKNQVSFMVHTLLPKARVHSNDATDALAAAICHAHGLASAITQHMRKAWA